MDKLELLQKQLARKRTVHETFGEAQRQVGVLVERADALLQANHTAALDQAEIRVVLALGKVTEALASVVQLLEHQNTVHEVIATMTAAKLSLKPGDIVVLKLGDPAVGWIPGPDDGNNAAQLFVEAFKGAGLDENAVVIWNYGIDVSVLTKDADLTDPVRRDGLKSQVECWRAQAEQEYANLNKAGSPHERWMTLTRHDQLRACANDLEGRLLGQEA